MLPPIIIIGTGRSGTSCTAAMIYAAGVDLGAKLIAADASNKRGHFEDFKLYKICKQIAERPNGDWNTRINQYISGRYERADLWAAKLPAILDSWDKFSVCWPTGYKLIWARRDPIASMKSYCHAYRSSYNAAKKLITRRSIASVNAYESYTGPKLIVDYEAVCSDPIVMSKTICGFIHVPWSKLVPAAVDISIRSF